MKTGFTVAAHCTVNPSYDATLTNGHPCLVATFTLCKGFYCTCISFIYREPDIKTEQLDTSGEQMIPVQEMTPVDDGFNKYTQTEESSR